MAAARPGLETVPWPYEGDPAAIGYALVWAPPRGELAGYPNLKAIFSVGAGIDHFKSDPDLPRHLPVVRMVEPALTAGMTEYVVLWVLHHPGSSASGAGTACPRRWPPGAGSAFSGSAPWAVTQPRSWRPSASPCRAGAAAPSRCRASNRSTAPRA